jgi:hypothetical protein
LINTFLAITQIGKDVFALTTKEETKENNH